jgi:hypothetical protein
VGAACAIVKWDDDGRYANHGSRRFLAKYLMDIVSTMEGPKKGTLNGTLRLKVFGS